MSHDRTEGMTMAIFDDLRAAHIDPTDRKAVIRSIASRVITPSQRAQLLREYELATKEPYLPQEFALAVAGKVPN